MRSLLWTLLALFMSIAGGKKIIGLMAVRNEESIIEQHVRALSLYVDSIVVLDDYSTDNTLNIINAIAKDCKIEKILTKEQWVRDEPGDKNLLLSTGRALGGTHFIILDADEMFTANCLKKDFLRKQILSLNPGEGLEFMWIHLLKSTKRYVSSTANGREYPVISGPAVFCDDTEQKSFYDSAFIHTSRIPNRPRPCVLRSLVNFDYGVLHFQMVNWDNYLIKQAWYCCLEAIRSKNSSQRDWLEKYNYVFDQMNKKIICKVCPNEWFDGYSFFKSSAYDVPENWRLQQIRSWMREYPRTLFDKMVFVDSIRKIKKLMV